MKNKNLIQRYLPVLIILVALANLVLFNPNRSSGKFTINDYSKLVESGKIEEATFSVGKNITTVKGTYTDMAKKATFEVSFPSHSELLNTSINKLKEKNISVVDSEASNKFVDAIINLIPFVLMMGFGFWMISRMAQANGANGKAFEFKSSFGK